MFHIAREFVVLLHRQIAALGFRTIRTEAKSAKSVPKAMTDGEQRPLRWLSRSKQRQLLSVSVAPTPTATPCRQRVGAHTAKPAPAEPWLALRRPTRPADCGLERNTPVVRRSAPRLLWWENVDGTTEFAWVGHHEDPMPSPRKA